jgi:hypothetical protein
MLPSEPKMTCRATVPPWGNSRRNATQRRQGGGANFARAGGAAGSPGVGGRTDCGPRHFSHPQPFRDDPDLCPGVVD